MTKKSNGITKVDAYAIVRSDDSDFAAIMRANVGGGSLSQFDLDRLKVPAAGGTTWELEGLEGPKEFKVLEGVIVAWKDTRQYYASNFSDGGSQPPDCSSQDSITGMGDPGGACFDCPFSKFGSTETGGKGQACKQTRLLFILREFDVLPLVLVVPPASLKPLQKYMLQLASRSLPYFGVVSKFSLEKTKNDQGIAYSRIVPSLANTLGVEDVERFKLFGSNIQQVFGQVRLEAHDVL